MVLQDTFPFCPKVQNQFKGTIWPPSWLLLADIPISMYLNFTPSKLDMCRLPQHFPQKSANFTLSLLALQLAAPNLQAPVLGDRKDTFRIFSAVPLQLQDAVAMSFPKEELGRW